MTTLEDYLNFPVPTKGIREMYKPEVTVTSQGWTQIHVDVMRLDGTDDSGQEIWTKVAEYDRNYSLLKTFEPFQQLQDGRWRHYALISTRYTRLEVLDLQNGEIIAVEPFPKADQRFAENSNGKYKEGDELPGFGFCPMEFHVPDWWDEFDESFLPKKDPETGQLKQGFHSEDFAISLVDEFNAYTGQWALYGGCIWGDDSSAKLRYIDLSKISEGIVAADERFGYVSLPNDLPISKSVVIHADEDYLEILTPIMFRLDTGKAMHKEFVMGSINWEEK